MMPLSLAKKISKHATDPDFVQHRFNHSVSLDLDRRHNDVRIATVGNSDSGKSTIIGVLTKRLMDDGNGSAR